MSDENQLEPDLETSEQDRPEVTGEAGSYGVLPLRNSVLFPHAVMPISVGRIRWGNSTPHGRK